MGETNETIAVCMPHIRARAAAFVMVVLLGSMAYVFGCGSGGVDSGSDTTSTASTAITGTVQVPSAASANIAKAVGTKAADPADVSAAGVKCEAKIYGGASLGTATTDANGKFSIPVTAADANGKDVTIICAVGNKSEQWSLEPEAAVVEGAATDVGEIDPDSTIAFQFVVRDCEKQLGASVKKSDLSACAAAKTAGKLAPPKALWKTYAPLVKKSGDPGTSTTLGLAKALRKAFAQALADGTADVDALLENIFSGDATAQSTFSSLAGITLGSDAMSQLDTALTTFGDLFEDTDTYAGYNKTGKWDACADWWATADAAKVAKDPTFMKKFLQQGASNYVAGDATALDILSKAGDMLGELSEECESITKSDYETIFSLIDKVHEKVAEQTSHDADALAKGICKTLSGSGTSAKMAQLKSAATIIAGGLASNPKAFSGDSAGEVLNDWLLVAKQLVAGGFGNANFQPCTTKSDCPADAACGSGSYCVGASEKQTCGTSNAPMGCPCTDASQCQTGVCKNENCDTSGVSDPLTGKPVGGSCTTSADCISGFCSAQGVCISQVALSNFNGTWTSNNVGCISSPVTIASGGFTATFANTSTTFTFALSTAQGACTASGSGEAGSCLCSYTGTGVSGSTLDIQCPANTGCSSKLVKQ